MDARLFAQDLAQKPERLAELARSLRADDPWDALPVSQDADVVFLGMGSSHYASTVAAARLRSRGVRAIAEIASNDLLPRVHRSTLVVAVSASGGSRETVDAVDRLDGRGRLVALTNSDDSPLASRADLVVPMRAGPEAGGVACRSFQHTLALLLALENRLLGDVPVADVVGAAGRASAELLGRESEWLPAVTDALIGPAGTHTVAPARRLSSALQSALMLREGPRRAATGCETGDWSHVDVYLTKNTDYRMLLFGGSRWEHELLDWAMKRSTTIVSVGQDVEAASVTVRYPGDDIDDVRLLTETLVIELVAARLWETQPRAT